jgi:hypothetical protein
MSNRRTNGGFNATREMWLSGVLADPRLTHATTRVASALFLHFNEKHWHATGEFKAWPKWDTLMEETAIGSKATIDAAIDALEEASYLEPDRGRYDAKIGKRKHNVYRVSKVQILNLAKVQKLNLETGSKVQFLHSKVQFLQNQGSKTVLDSSERDSIDKDSSVLYTENGRQEEIFEKRFRERWGDDFHTLRNRVIESARVFARRPDMIQVFGDHGERGELALAFAITQAACSTDDPPAYIRRFIEEPESFPSRR